jgi:predicted nucleic acid-binding protein
MRYLADINVVFSLLVAGHEHNPVSWKWWEQREPESVLWVLPIKLGVLRLLTNNVAMAGNPLAPIEALGAWDAFHRDTRTSELEFPSTAQDLKLRQFIEGRRASPNLWTDAWLAAVAESSACTLTSFDAGFQSFGLTSFEFLKA